MPETRRYQPVQMVQYFAKSLARETDLLAEMRHLQRFATLYANHPAVHIPKVYPEYSNRQVLVQEYVAATLLKDTDIELLGTEERHILACRITDVLLDMILGQGLFHADPHPGNIFNLSRFAYRPDRLRYDRLPESGAPAGNQCAD